LNFLINEDTVSAQYDLDGELAVKVVIPKPKRYWVPINIGAINYCGFRGMLMASFIYFKTKLGFTLGRRNKKQAKLIVGNHPRVQWLKQIDVADAPFVTAFLPTFEGNLDDHFECWFISKENEITEIPEGLEHTYPLGYGEEWPPPPVDNDATDETSRSDSQTVAAGLTFSETMAGGFSLDETDPQIGEKAGKAKGNVLAMHASISIDDIDAFVSDPEHCGKISGTIDFTPFGKALTTTHGQFNLFCPTDDPNCKYMVYELGFKHNGKDYYVAGKKEVKDDAGFDLWSDTTTLYTKLYEGTDATGKQIGAGVLSLGITDLLSMLTTFKATNCRTVAESGQCIAKFGRFFLGELWDNYQPSANEEKETHVA
ncbi:MAG: hypothetical protein OEZ58_24105, partial [Gammaproteobacteria bacterium]|nr:hypothetical protein [Gammaproteobacteria bacterium]